MATRQYVGARYVPQFFSGGGGSNEWVSGIAYEPLTIVTYLNNSFTSKIPVPAGVGNPADSPEYWVNTGNYNGQVDAYRTEVQKIQGELSNLQAKNVIILTDSYGNYKVEDKNFCQLAAQYAGLTNAQIFSVGGCSFGGSTNNFKSLLQNNIASVSSPNDITDIYVLGGANDQTFTESQILGGIGDFCTYAASAFPNAKVSIGFVTKSFETAYYPAAPATKMAYTKCTIYGATYLSHSEAIMQKYSLFNTDLVHPNTEGVQRLAYYTAQLLTRYSCDVYDKISVPLSINPEHNLVTNNGATLISTMAFTQNNNNVTLSAGGAGAICTITLSTPTEIAFEYALSDLLLLSDTCAISTTGNNCNFSGIAVLTDTSGSRKLGSVIFYIPTKTVNGKFPLNAFIYPVENVANVNKISLYGFGTVQAF